MTGQPGQLEHDSVPPPSHRRSGRERAERGPSLTARAAARLLLLAIVSFTTVPPLLLPGAEPGASLLEELGRRAALLAFGLLGLQVVLSARLRFADLAVGLDTLLRAHRAVGVLVLLLLLAHPTLLVLASHGDMPFLRWQLLLGVFALLVLTAGVLSALLFRFLRMDFNRWRAIHRAMILVVLLGAAHARAAGSDLQGAPALRAWWSALLAVALGVLAWRHLVVRRYRLRRFRVESVRPEARGVWTIQLVPEGGRPLRYLPGQFIFLTLLRAAAPTEEHPFTISSPPSRPGFITATVKESGDFTRTIGLTRSGDHALVEGPFGRFSFAHHPARRFLFISAGVGCTPIASMLRYLSDSGDSRPALYLCANRTEEDIASERSSLGYPSA